MRPLLQSDADEDVGATLARPAVVELGHRPPVERIEKAAIDGAVVGHGDGQQGLGPLADLGPLGDVTQPVEIDVGAGVDGDQGAVVDGLRMGGGPGLEAGQGQGAGRLGDGAAVVEDVLDGGADGVVVDGDDLVEQVLAQAEGLVARAAHGDAVAEQTDLIQGDDLARLDGGLHRGGVDGFDADDLRAGPQEFDDGCDAGRQAPAADWDEDGGDGLGMLAGDLQTDRALAGDDVGVVEGVDEDGAGLGRACGSPRRRPRRRRRRAGRRFRPARARPRP